MAVSLLHAYTSPVADAGEADKVGPDEWNAQHVLACATGVLLGRTTAGNGAVEEITPGSDFTMTALALALSAVIAAGTIGSATLSPVITYDTKGRITAVSSAIIAPPASAITGGQALTKADDTNVTLTLGGSPTDALLKAASLSLGWTGTLAAARLNSSVVQGITNDTNVTGSIAAQVLTLGWTGTLAAARLNANVVQAVVNDTNVTGSIATQTLTLAWSGTLALARLAQGTDGQLIVGQTSASPLYKSITGDWSLSAAGAATLATVNSNVGTFGSATQSVQFTVNAKGLITAAANVTVTPAVGSITGLGTGVATWLATPSSANLLAAVTDETGSGALVFGTSPTLTTSALLTSGFVFNWNASDVTLTHSANLLTIAGGSLTLSDAAAALVIGDISVAAVNNNELVFASGDSIRLSDTGIITFATGGDGVYLGRDGVDTAVAFYNRTADTKTEVVISPSGSPATAEWAVLSVNRVSGSNEERFNIIARGASQDYLFTQVITGTGSYRPMLFANNAATAFTISTVPDVTFAVDVFAPKLIGGTGTGSTLTLKTTTGVGATDAMIFQVGNNGATEAARFLTGGQLIKGHTASVTLDSLTPGVQVHGLTAGNSGLSNARWQNNNAAPANFFFKSRGATVGDFTIVQSGDILGDIRFLGADGSASARAAIIRAEVDGTPGASDMPGRLLFLTSPDGSATVTEALRINALQASLFTGHIQPTAGFKRVATQFDKTSDTTLADITGLSVSVNAGLSYAFEAVLYTTANVAGGVKFAIAGTATATAVIYESVLFLGSVATATGTERATALATTVGDLTAATVAYVIITGLITVNAAGTLTVQFAQNASNGSASSVLVGSTLKVFQVA